jgi:hypothetical protein
MDIQSVINARIEQRLGGAEIRAEMLQVHLEAKEGELRNALARIAELERAAGSAASVASVGKPTDSEHEKNRNANGARARREADDELRTGASAI